MAYLSLLSLNGAVSLGCEGTVRDTSTQPMCEVFESDDGWVSSPLRSSKQEEGSPGERTMFRQDMRRRYLNGVSDPCSSKKYIFFKSILHLNLCLI